MNNERLYMKNHDKKIINDINSITLKIIEHACQQWHGNFEKYSVNFVNQNYH